jgi:hypothetical protein
VEQGIDSISLNPDSVVTTVPNQVEVERGLGIEPRTSGWAGAFAGPLAFTSL